MEILFKNALNHLFLSGTEDAVVDEDAGELVADGLMEESRDHR